MKRWSGRLGRQMVRMVSLVCLGMLLMGLAACGGEETPGKAVAQAPKAKKPAVYGHDRDDGITRIVILAKADSERLASFASPQTVLNTQPMDSGVAQDRTHSSAVGEVLAANSLLRAAIRADSGGMDALVVSTSDERILTALREAVSIPVLSVGESGGHIAMQLGKRVVLVGRDVRHGERTAALLNRRGGMVRFVACAGESDVGLSQNVGVCIRDAGADTIVLLDDALGSRAEELAATLRDHGSAVTVVDAFAMAVLQAETLVRAGLSHSPVAYPRVQVPGEYSPAQGEHQKTPPATPQEPLQQTSELRVPDGTRSGAATQERPGSEPVAFVSERPSAFSALQRKHR